MHLSIFIIIFFLLAICLFFYCIQELQKKWYYWLTFAFLPSKLKIRKATNIYTWNIPILGPLLNYTTACIINMIDATIWLFQWIPGFLFIAKILYHTADSLERYLSWFLGGISGHRNFISHSCINPIYLGFLFLSHIILQTISFHSIRIIVQFLCFLLSLTFIAHLLADTLPKAWIGKALIKIVFIFHFSTLSIGKSKAWLHINAILAFIFSLYALNIFTWFV